MSTVKLLIFIVVMHCVNLVSADNSHNNNDNNSSLCPISEIPVSNSTVVVANEEHDLTHEQRTEFFLTVLDQDITNYYRGQQKKVVLASLAFMVGLVGYTLTVLIYQFEKGVH